MSLGRLRDLQLAYTFSYRIKSRTFAFYTKRKKFNNLDIIKSSFFSLSNFAIYFIKANIKIPAATATFNDSACPFIGI